MRKTFHDQLAEVESLCIECAGVVLRQLERAMQALSKRDEDLATIVVAGDDDVDKLYVEVERRVLELMATQAPVASDLRLIAAILHINIHLERMGDLCTTIAKFVGLTRDLPVSEQVLLELDEMGKMAGRAIDTAARAFARRDLELALSLAESDKPLSRLNRGMIRHVAEFAGDELRLEWMTRMVLVSRFIERLGDQAVDIGEQVAFLLTGEFRQFTDASHKADV